MAGCREVGSHNPHGDLHHDKETARTPGEQELSRGRKPGPAVGKVGCPESSDSQGGPWLSHGTGKPTLSPSQGMRR